MNQTNVNYATLLPALLGVLKLVLQPFGIDLSHITDQQVNDVSNGIAAILAIVGVFMTHKKPEGGTTDVTSQPTNIISNNK